MNSAVAIRPWRSLSAWPAWAYRALPMGAAAASLCYVLDRRGANAVELIVTLVVFIASITDRRLRQWRTVITALALLLAATLLALTIALPFAQHPLGSLLKDLLRSRVLFLWMAATWILLPLWPRALAPGPGRVLAILGVLHHVLAFWALAACLASPNTRISFTSLREEWLGYTALVGILIRLGLAGSPILATAQWRRIWRWSVRAFIAGLAATVVAMGSVVALHAAGGPRSAELERVGWIRVEPDAPDQPKRLQFPFSHHNRAGFFLLMVVFIALMAAISDKGVWRWIAAATAIGALVLQPFPLTRGAMVGTALGLCCTALLAGANLWKKPAAWAVLVVAMALGYAIVPAANRQHLTQMLQRSSYTPGAATTINARVALWAMSFDSISRRPLLGFGYGSDNFLPIMTQEHPDVMAKLAGSSHAHNLVLEWGVECGIPAAMLLVAIMLIRWALLGSAWWAAHHHRAMRRTALLLTLWIGWEIAVLAFAMGNHPLRRGSGLVVIAMQTLGAILAWQATRQAKKNLA